MAGKRETATVDVIINGAKASETTKELIGNIRQLRAALQNLPWDSPEYKKAQNALKDLEKQYDKVSGKVKQTALSMESLGKSIMNWGGAMAAGVLSMETFKKAIAATDAMSDKFEETVTGIKFGVDAFFRAIITGNFSNFITNMGEAIKLGKEYARVMDQIEERTRALSIVESEQRIKILDLQKVMKDQRLTAEERAKAAHEALKLENQLMQDKYSISRTNFNMELKVAATQAGIAEASVANFLKQRDANNELVKKAEEYNELLAEKSRLMKVDSRDQDKQNQIAAINTKLQQFDTTTKVYATEIVKKMGQVSKEQLDKTANAWVSLNNTQVEFREGTKRTWSTYTGLLNEIKNKGVKAGKDEQKEAEKMISLLTERRMLEVMFMDGKIEDLEKWLQKLGLEADKYKEMIVYINQLGQLRMGIKDFGGMNTMPAKPGEMQKIWNPNPDELDKMTWDQKAQNVVNYAQTVISILSSLDQAKTSQENADLQRDEALNQKKKENLEKQLLAKRITQSQYNQEIAKLDADLAKKQRQIQHDQAVRNKEIQLMNAIMGAAQMAISGFTTTPFMPLGLIMGALAIALGAVQVATIAKTKVPAAAGGRYNVIGQEDGRAYNDVPYVPSFTGIPGRPMLVNETGNEIVIDPRTTRNLMVNYPEVINAINYARVPQRAAGQYPAATPMAAPPTVTVVDPKLTAAIDKFNTVADRMLNEGLQARMAYDDFTRVDDKINRINQDASRV